MADRYALVRNSLVENVVEWDGGDQWTPPADILAVRLDLRLSTHKACGPGYTYEGGTFTAPAPRVPQEPEAFQFTPRDFLEALLTAMVQEGVIPSPAKAQAIAVRARNALKR